jgi:hypothetical protein
MASVSFLQERLRPVTARVVPGHNTKAGAQDLQRSVGCPWVPAFAGMTKEKIGYEVSNAYH